MDSASNGSAAAFYSEVMLALAIPPVATAMAKIAADPTISFTPACAAVLRFI